MDWLTFISTETKALVWPSVVLFTMFLFRKNVALLLARFGRRKVTVKSGETEVTISEELDKIEEVDPPKPQTIEIAPLEMRAKLGTFTVTREEPATERDDLAEMPRAYDGGGALPPDYVISQAWLRLLDEIRLLLASHRPKNEEIRSAGEQLRAIRESNLLNADDLKQLNELRRLRNNIVHNSAVHVTRTDALRYNDLANGLIERLRSKRLPQLPSSPTASP